MNEKKFPSLFGIFNFDRKAMEDGRWMPFHGGEILLSRAGMPRYNVALLEANEKYADEAKEAKGNKTLEASVSRKILVHTLANGVILDWRGFEEPYSPQVAERLLEAQQDALDEIYNMANRRENFRREEIEAAAPN